MNQVFPSNLKLEFAEYFLNQILNLNENEELYRTARTSPDGLTNAVGATDTEKILKNLNCFIECYFFTAMSSLDSLAYEIFEKFNLTKLQKIYITSFNKEEIRENLREKSQNTLDFIEKFLQDDDFKDFKSYRDFIAHKSILSKELSFETIEILGKGSFSKLKRPIFVPKIEKDKLSEDKLDLMDYLKRVHDKINGLHKEIKK